MRANSVLLFWPFCARWNGKPSRPENRCSIRLSITFNRCCHPCLLQYLVVSSHQPKPYVIYLQLPSKPKQSLCTMRKASSLVDLGVKREIWMGKEIGQWSSKDIRRWDTTDWQKKTQVHTLGKARSCNRVSQHNFWSRSNYRYFSIYR